MRKFKRFAFLFLFLVIIILSFTIYTNASKDSRDDIKEKSLSEIKYVESKLINMFNSLNNIEFENYKISSEQINKEESNSSSNTSNKNGEEAGSSSSNSSSNSDSESGNSSGSTSSGSGNSSSESSNAPLGNNNQKYSLNAVGVLNNDSNINWDYIKKEAEGLTSSLSAITLDLYDISLNQSDILNFNKEYDNLLVATKQEDKGKTLNELNLLYSYIPKFIKNCSNDEQYKNIIETKQYIFNAYSILDNNDWDAINSSVKSAIETYSKLVTDINLETEKQYNINKAYIMINDLQNAVNLKDKEIFLIKYKNLLEELNNI